MTFLSRKNIRIMDKLRIHYYSIFMLISFIAVIEWALFFLIPSAAYKTAILHVIFYLHLGMDVIFIMLICGFLKFGYALSRSMATFDGDRMASPETSPNDNGCRAPRLATPAAMLDRALAGLRDAHQEACLARESIDAAERAGESCWDALWHVFDTLNSLQASLERAAETLAVIEQSAVAVNLLAADVLCGCTQTDSPVIPCRVKAADVEGLSQRFGEAAQALNGLLFASTEPPGQERVAVRSASGPVEPILLQVTRMTDMLAELRLSSYNQEAILQQAKQCIGQIETLSRNVLAIKDEDLPDRWSPTPPGDELQTVQDDVLRLVASLWESDNY